MAPSSSRSGPPSDETKFVSIPTAITTRVPYAPDAHLPELSKQSDALDVARVLFARYGGTVDTDTLFDLSEACNCDPQAVDTALDGIRAEAAVGVEIVDPKSLITLDLRATESTRHRVVGVGHWLTAEERKSFGGVDYLLVREPENEFDSNAVAVYLENRKIGYTTAARARILAPLLDPLPANSFRVSGDSDLAVNIPIPTALRQVRHSLGRR